MTSQTKVRVIEIVSLLAIIASAIALAGPKRAALNRRAIAAQVSADVDVVRAAIYAFYSDSAYFPPKLGHERIPENLTPYLPRGFALTRPYGTLEYQNWTVRPTAADMAAPNVVGVTVTMKDRKVGAAVVTMSPRAARFAVGNRYTFLFFGV